jgi:hypothetical protein
MKVKQHADKRPRGEFDDVELHRSTSTLDPTVCYLHTETEIWPPARHMTYLSTEYTNTDKIVLSLTNKTFDPAAISILSKDLNYVQATSLKSNLKDIVSGIEQAIQHLLTDTAVKIRRETSCIIRHSKSPKRNTSQAEQDALQALQNDKGFIKLPADKGNATVVLY